MGLSGLGPMIAGWKIGSVCNMHPTLPIPHKTNSHQGWFFSCVDLSEISSYWWVERSRSSFIVKNLTLQTSRLHCFHMCNCLKCFGQCCIVSIFFREPPNPVLTSNSLYFFGGSLGAGLSLVLPISKPSQRWFLLSDVRSAVSKHVWNRF